MNIGSKLILSFLVVTLLPTILLAYLTTSLISGSSKEYAQQTLNHNLRAAWMQYYARAHQMQYGMLQASTEPSLRQALTGRNTAYLREQLNAWKKYRPYVDIWAFVDRNAVVVASINTPKTGARMDINGLLKKAVEKKTSFISTEIVGPEFLKRENLTESARIRVPDGQSDTAPTENQDEGMALFVVTPVMDQRGVVVGAIITGDLLNNDPFVAESLAENIPGSMSTITMRGVQIATNVTDPDGKTTAGQRMPRVVMEDIEKNKSFRGETSMGGSMYITAFDPIVNSEGRIIGTLSVAVSRDKFIELQKKNIKAVAVISLIGLMIAAAAAYLITYMITRPIKSLTKKAELVSAGDLDVTSGALMEGGDELAGLARAFDVMVDHLRDKEDKIGLSQESILRQKNLIESIINSLPYCLYVLERNMAIAVWNRHSVKPCPICNCSSEDCYNVNFILHLKNTELKSGLEKAITSVFDTGEACQLEQKLTLKPDGRTTHLRMSIFPIYSTRGRSADYVVWMAEDITRKKALEANIIASEKLAAVGQLAAGMAHEVNNPLGGILNCLYNLKKTRLAEERKAEYLDFMEDGIKRVQNIMRQLLDFSQQHPPEFALTDINRMIEGLAPLFLHSVKDKDIRLVRNLGEGLPAILVDKHQIEQVLVNLILNALAAVDDEGVVEISTRFADEWYCITVSDNGCGIKPQDISRIFDPFFTTKGVGKGTGLGLSVSRGIIEQHRGRIEVASRPGKGAVFTLYLPISS